jgi:hypothetical protein
MPISILNYLSFYVLRIVKSKKCFSKQKRKQGRILEHQLSLPGIAGSDLPQVPQVVLPGRAGIQQFSNLF